MKYKLMVIGSALLMHQAWADTVRCPHERVKGIQVQPNGTIVYISDKNTRRLASVSSTSAEGGGSGSDTILQSLLTAIDKRYYVQAGFPEGYDCSKDNMTVPLNWIYVQATQMHQSSAAKNKK